MSTFQDLHLTPPLLRALSAESHRHPTPIQTQAIPALLAGKDVLACAQTGTGKTAAFALPTLQRLSCSPPSGAPTGARALVLTPTRELAAQVGERFAAYGRFTKLSTAVIYGGVSDKGQIRALREIPDIIVATPGRLLDLFVRGHVAMDHIEVLVLDEADRMLDMGFIHDIRRIVGHLPRTRQSLLFSATLPPAIKTLAQSFLIDPIRVSVSPKQTTVHSVDQSFVRVEQADKKAKLLELLRAPGVERAIVFTRTKRGADRLARHLERANVRAASIHGDKNQRARQRALDGFRRGHSSVLVATDVAARGIDVEDVTHVFNFELPNEAESYVHRIGRTGRAGRAGVAISLCAPAESDNLRAIERLIGSTPTRCPKRARLAPRKSERRSA